MQEIPGRHPLPPRHVTWHRILIYTPPHESMQNQLHGVCQARADGSICSHKLACVRQCEQTSVKQCAARYILHGITCSKYGGQRPGANSMEWLRATCFVCVGCVWAPIVYRIMKIGAGLRHFPELDVVGGSTGRRMASRSKVSSLATSSFETCSSSSSDSVSSSSGAGL